MLLLPQNFLFGQLCQIFILPKRDFEIFSEKKGDSFVESRTKSKKYLIRNDHIKRSILNMFVYLLSSLILDRTEAKCYYDLLFIFYRLSIKHYA